MHPTRRRPIASRSSSTATPPSRSPPAPAAASSCTRSTGRRHRRSVAHHSTRARCVSSSRSYARRHIPSSCSSRSRSTKSSRERGTCPRSRSSRPQPFDASASARGITSRGSPLRSWYDVAPPITKSPITQIATCATRFDAGDCGDRSFDLDRRDHLHVGELHHLDVQRRREVGRHRGAHRKWPGSRMTSTSSIAFIIVRTPLRSS